MPAHDDALRVEADEGAVQQALTNLVVNAIHAMPDGGTVQIGATFVEQTPPPDVEGTSRRWLAIEVEDTGTGMDATTRRASSSRSSRPRTSARAPASASRVTYGIVREHGGWIDVDSRARQRGRVHRLPAPGWSVPT